MRWNDIPEPPVEPPEKPMPHCPCCGEETDRVYKNQYGTIVGCDQCVFEVSAFDTSFPARRKRKVV